MYLNKGPFMEGELQSICQLIFNAGLVICFGLGVIGGGQR
ncbi:tail virion protein G7P-2 [Enterobacter bugandensis]